MRDFGRSGPCAIARGFGSRGMRSDRRPEKPFYIGGWRRYESLVLSGDSVAFVPSGRQLIPCADIPELDDVPGDWSKFVVAQDGNPKSSFQVCRIILRIALGRAKGLEQFADRAVADNAGCCGVVKLCLSGSAELESGEICQESRQLTKILKLGLIDIGTHSFSSVR